MFTYLLESRIKPSGKLTLAQSSLRFGGGGWGGGGVVINLDR